MEFKRLNKNSKLKVFILTNGTMGDAIAEILNIESSNSLVLQVALISGTCLIIEYISKLEETMIDEPKSKHDIDFENYLETTINKDPFGGKYSGMKLKTIFEQGDKQWLETALKEMKNEFIKDRLKYIVERGGYGKIIYQ